MSTLSPLLAGGRGPSGFQVPHSLAISTPRHLPCRERKLQARRGLLRVRAFFNAPVVIFHLNILSYFAFLCLFAYVLMVDFQPTPSCCEYLIHFWLFSLVCEELRQVRPPAPFPTSPHPQPTWTVLWSPTPPGSARPWDRQPGHFHGWAHSGLTKHPDTTARAWAGIRAPGRQVRGQVREAGAGQCYPAGLSPAFLWLHSLLKPDPLPEAKPQPQRWQP